MNGMERFEYYLNKVEDLLQRSSNEENPGWWLFTNDLRTPMFMLEALAKLYSKLHDKDLFNKLQDRFKELEDELGDIDYFNAYEKEFSSGPGATPATTTYFREKKEEELRLFNKMLEDNKWIGKENGRVDKIRKKLQEVTWLSEHEEMIEIKKFYHNAIESIQEFYASIEGPFIDMEEQVHEIRRKLRWLSIYPQALRGSLQLSDKAQAEPHLSKYLVPEIVNSPYNKLPDPIGCRYVLLLEKNYFLALSWLISELGKLKDAGLGIIALEESSTHNRDSDIDTNKVAPGTNPPAALQDHLSKATDITKVFFEEKNLDKMVGEVEELRP